MVVVMYRSNGFLCHVTSNNAHLLCTFLKSTQQTNIIVLVAVKSSETYIFFCLLSTLCQIISDKLCIWVLKLSHVMTLTPEIIVYISATKWSTVRLQSSEKDILKKSALFQVYEYLSCIVYFTCHWASVQMQIFILKLKRLQKD